MEGLRLLCCNSSSSSSSSLTATQRACLLDCAASPPSHPYLPPLLAPSSAPLQPVAGKFRASVPHSATRRKVPGAQCVDGAEPWRSAAADCAASHGAGSAAAVQTVAARAAASGTKEADVRTRQWADARYCHVLEQLLCVGSDCWVSYSLLV